MMAEALLLQSRLRLQFVTGINEDGEQTFKMRTFNNVKKSSTAAELYSTATSLASLSDYELEKIERNDQYDIIG